jgi:hypothetical protein
VIGAKALATFHVGDLSSYFSLEYVYVREAIHEVHSHGLTDLRRLRFGRPRRTSRILRARFIQLCTRNAGLVCASIRTMEGRLVDVNTGTTVYHIRDERVVDGNGLTVYRIDDERVVDGNGLTVYRIHDERVVDERTGVTVYRIRS